MSKQSQTSLTAEEINAAVKVADDSWRDLLQSTESVERVQHRRISVVDLIRAVAGSKALRKNDEPSSSVAEDVAVASTSSSANTGSVSRRIVIQKLQQKIRGTKAYRDKVESAVQQQTHTVSSKVTDVSGSSSCGGTVVVPRQNGLRCSLTSVDSSLTVEEVNTALEIEDRMWQRWLQDKNRVDVKQEERISLSTLQRLVRGFTFEGSIDPQNVADTDRVAPSLLSFNGIERSTTTAERMVNLRQRRKRKAPVIESKETNDEPTNSKSTNTEPKTKTSKLRMKKFREKQKILNAGCELRIEQQIDDYEFSNSGSALDEAFWTMFVANDFGHVCSICDRLWFKNDMTYVNVLRKNKEKVLQILRKEFTNEDVLSFRICVTCRDSLLQCRIPPLSKSNGFVYPEYPNNLPKLDCVTERLVSPRLPFMQIRRLRYTGGSKKIIGQVVNVPVDVREMVAVLPRQLDDDQAINVHIKRHLLHKSSYIEGFVKKSVIKVWLDYLLKKPLYVQNKITVEADFLSSVHSSTTGNESESEEERIEKVDDKLLTGTEMLIAVQRSMLWSEEKYLAMAPAASKCALNLVYDEFAEELSFPSIYLGEPRQFKRGVLVTPYMIATSEIRRSDRRGAVPDHILYMASKIMRLRLSGELTHQFRKTSDLAKVTRKMIEDSEFLERTIDHNMSFLRSIPNSATYWACRKRDVFAMLRQLGKPTMFLTLSANEVRWPNLLRLLYKLKHKKDFEGNIMELSSLERAHLVNDDSVSCDLYFNKLVDVFMTLLQRKRSSVFGRYRVIDYFKRIEFQHRGSPHAHILLWLENDYSGEVTENMPSAVNMVDELCSVDVSELKRPQNQIHHHTFTCYKRNETVCRFGAPFWPMQKTTVLLPMSVEDHRRNKLRTRYKMLHINLEIEDYSSIEDFWKQNHITDEAEYFNILRAGISRPTLFIKRRVDQKMVNVFNPWIAEKLNSNMDLQFILEEYSCAAYVVEYVNKANRGISNLHRELIKLRDEFPDKDYGELLKAVGIKILNNVEMSTQEAAWFLLRLPMSKSSRDIIYIPTVWPHERICVKKTKSRLDKENVKEEDTNIWTDNIIERYEKRSSDLEQISLAEFVSQYNHLGNKAKTQRVIRYRAYTMDDLDEYKREKVLLYFPFRSEALDLLDRNKFLQIYAEHERQILERASVYESGMDIDKVVKVAREMQDLVDQAVTAEKLEQYNKSRKAENIDEVFGLPKINNDDLKAIHATKLNGLIRKRENVLTAEEYCKRMRCANYEQRSLILESIYRMIYLRSKPTQIFFTGPAGCGKTFTMKLMMETYNRFSQHHSSNYNSFIACASTGKAASAIGGVTVHSAFKITMNREGSGLRLDQLSSYRYAFDGIEAVFIDEISMIGSEVFHTINGRLAQITNNHEQFFGGMNIVFCGDLRQLPPVMSTPIYKRHRQRITGEMLWHQLEYYPLVQVMRQSDKVFSQILTKIGDGEELTDEEAGILESRFVSKEDAAYLAQDAVRLFLSNAAVEGYNNEVTNIPEAVVGLSADVYSGYINNEQLTSMRAKVHKMRTIETSGLPYKIYLVIGRPYMITTNIDVNDGLVNGSIGVLRFIEYESDGIKRLWLEFPTDAVGRLQRTKCKSYVQNNPQLNLKWVPLLKRTANITFSTRTLNCRRTQFPIVEAAALTIHKSQGGTYDQIVYEYSRSHEQSLVYVALSRVTSLSGLYLTNKDNDFTFYHKRENRNKPLHVEFQRLKRHKMETITDKCVQLFSSVGPNALSLTTINVQSLRAHKEDVVSDFVAKKSKILSLTETWAKNDEVIQLPGFKPICQYKREGVRSGGVAIYENEDSTLNATKHKFVLKGQLSDLEDPVGDICAAEVEINGKLALIVSYYITPGTSLRNIKEFFEMNLLSYCSKVVDVVESLQRRGYKDIPIIMSGDLNLDLQSDDGKEFINFMANSFDVQLKSDRLIPTTRGGTTIDAVFTRFVEELPCVNFVSYYSYHQPILSITKEPVENSVTDL